ncbi:MAG: histidine phosphatase family protein [Bauldia sp.]|nr:histidine phosphatase family protein [Bauldia sp.]
MAEHQELWLFRHGETDWSASGRHTGRTDLPLNKAGEARAKAIGKRLRGRPFALVLSSPLIRAVETCRLAGYANGAQIDDDLMEWDYGNYEGRKTVDIRKQRPGWMLWKDGVPNGETVEHVGERADRVIARALATDGDVALFAHAHILRILTARWLGLPAADGQLFALGTATVSVLGFEHEYRVIIRWNQNSHLVEV